MSDGYISGGGPVCYPRVRRACLGAAAAGVAQPPGEKLQDADIMSQLPDNIHLLNVGLDAARLDPVIAALALAGYGRTKSTG